MSDTAHTPDDLTIIKRDWKFGRGANYERWWFGGDVIRTAFFTALSATFPIGEKYFMTSVKHYRDETSMPLRGQIDDFMYQESMHSREHVFFNQQAERAGYDIKKLEERTRRMVNWAKSRPALLQLSSTCALEHFTATLANAALSDDLQLEGMPEEALKMWRWHAVEEIEHKAVAYDTLVHVTRNRSAFSNWWRRCVVMTFSTIRFHMVLFGNIKDLLKEDGMNDAKTWSRMLRYLYGRKGPMRILVVGAFGYMKPRFHPWDHDDRALVAKTLATFPPAMAAQH